MSGYADKNGKPYSDNLCFFRALSYFRGNEKTLEVSTKEYFRSFLQVKPQSEETFQGVSLSDLPVLESLFNTSINVYTLELQEGEYIARLVARSHTNHNNQLNLNIQSTHFSWIKNLRLYTKSYKCVYCEKLVKSAGALKQHSLSCNSGSTKFDHPFGAFTTPKTIYDKLKEVGITLDESRRYYPFWAVFDAETFITSDSQNLPKNTQTITWNSKHNLASVSVCSNVAGFTEPRCFVNEGYNEQNVVNCMLDYLSELSQTCKERLLIRYNDVFESIAEKRSEAIALEMSVMDGMGVGNVEKKFDSLETDLENYLSELLVFGFNSSSFDLPLIKSMLISQLILNGERLKYVVKKGSNYMAIATDSLKFLDICNFLAPGFSYSEYLKAFEVEEQKFVWIHEKFTSLDVLNRTSFPAHEEFYSSLKNSNISLEQYNLAYEVWKKEKMKTLKDMLIYYNNADCNVNSDIISSYNNTIHSSIGIKPVDVNPNNQEEIWNRLYNPDSTIKQYFQQPKFEVGDNVRISKYSTVFRKGYLPLWSTEIFKILNVHFTSPPVYSLSDYSGDKLTGTWYEQELQKVDSSEAVYKIEKILSQRKIGGKIQYLVKWLGYPDSFNSYVNKSDLVQNYKS